MPDQSPLRASDAERDAVVAALQQHYAEGRLELTEMTARLELALTATTRRDLALPLADLPDLPSEPPSPVPTVTAGPLAPHRRASGPAAAAGTPLAPWLLTGVICLVIWASTSLASGTALYFWPFWVIAPWGAVMLAGRVTGRSLAGCGGSRHASER